MSIDLAQLKALAEAATPSEWYIDREGVFYIRAADAEYVCEVHAGNLSNVRYIAAANPAVLLELVERLERAEAALRAIVEYTPEAVSHDYYRGRQAGKDSQAQIAREALAALDAPKEAT